MKEKHEIRETFQTAKRLLEEMGSEAIYFEQLKQILEAVSKKTLKGLWRKVIRWNEKIYNDKIVSIRIRYFAF